MFIPNVRARLNWDVECYPTNLTERELEQTIGGVPVKDILQSDDVDLILFVGNRIKLDRLPEETIPDVFD